MATKSLTPLEAFAHRGSAAFLDSTLAFEGVPVHDGRARSPLCRLTRWRG